VSVRQLGVEREPPPPTLTWRDSSCFVSNHSRDCPASSTIAGGPCTSGVSKWLLVQPASQTKTAISRIERVAFLT